MCGLLARTIAVTNPEFYKSSLPDSARSQPLHPVPQLAVPALRFATHSFARNDLACDCPCDLIGITRIIGMLLLAHCCLRGWIPNAPEMRVTHRGNNWKPVLMMEQTGKSLHHGELFASGSAAIREGRMDEARSLFAQALEADPTHTATIAICSKLCLLETDEIASPPTLSESVHKFDDVSVHVLADPRKAGRIVGVLWESAPCLIRWLLADPERMSTYIKDKRVLELGAGLGLVGTALAKLGARHVTLTDLPQQLTLLRQNLEANFGAAADGKLADGRVAIAALPWGTTRFTGACGDRGVDLIVATDVCYDADLIRPLAKTLAALLRAHKGASALLAVPHRSEFEPPVLAPGSEERLPDWELLMQLLSARMTRAAAASCEDDEDACEDACEDEERSSSSARGTCEWQRLATIPSMPHPIDVVHVRVC